MKVAPPLPLLLLLVLALEQRGEVVIIIFSQHQVPTTILATTPSCNVVLTRINNNNRV
jgi:hypothetical protein